MIAPAIPSRPLEGIPCVDDDDDERCRQSLDESAKIRAAAEELAAQVESVDDGIVLDVADDGDSLVISLGDSIQQLAAS